MAEHTYELIIRNASGASSGSPSDAMPGGGAEDSEGANAQASMGFNEKLKGAAKTAMAMWSSMSVARQAIGYQVSRIGIRTGNSDAQERISFGMELAGQAASLVTSFIINPGVGAMAAIGIGISYLQKFDQFNEGAKWEAQQLQSNRFRAGVNWNRSRKEGM